MVDQPAPPRHEAAPERAPATVREDGPVRRAARRIVGVDAARGLALIGMVAVHTLPPVDERTGDASFVWTVFGGNSAALFATLAGVSLAFTSGGRSPHTGRRMRASRLSLVGRATVIALVGLLLGFLELPVDNILVYYGVFFLLSIPFLGLRIRHLLAGSALFALIAPFLMQWSLDHLPGHVYDNPSLLDLVTDPVTVVSQLLLTGTYPALPWMTFLLAGLAVGRMDITRRAVQIGIAAVGAVLASLAWASSTVALTVLGGYDALVEGTPWMSESQIDEVLVFGPDPALPTDTLGWLLITAPHSNTPFALAHSLGIVLLVLGIFLLLSRVAGRVLVPLAAMGAMTFTLYTSHLLILWPELYGDAPAVWFWGQVAAFLLFALLWQRGMGQGPLEKVVSKVSKGIVRRAMAGPGTTASA